MSNKSVRDVTQEIKDNVALCSSKILETVVSGVNTITKACEEKITEQQQEIGHLQETVKHLYEENEKLRNPAEPPVEPEPLALSVSDNNEAISAELEIYKNEVKRLNDEYAPMTGVLETINLIKQRANVRNSDGTFFYEWIRLRLAMLNESSPVKVTQVVHYLSYDIVDFTLMSELEVRSIVTCLIAEEPAVWYVIEPAMAQVYPDAHVFFVTEFFSEAPTVHDLDGAELVAENVPTTGDIDSLNEQVPEKKEPAPKKTRKPRGRNSLP